MAQLLGEEPGEGEAPGEDIPTTGKWRAVSLARLLLYGGLRLLGICRGAVQEQAVAAFWSLTVPTPAGRRMAFVAALLLLRLRLTPILPPAPWSCISNRSRPSKQPLGRSGGFPLCKYPASLHGSMFKGLSSLRAAEKKEVPLSEKAKAMQAYLASQYGGGSGGEPEKKKKKKKKRDAGGPGLKILDQDVSGFAPAAAAAAPAAGAGPGGEEEEEDEGEWPGTWAVRLECSVQSPSPGAAGVAVARCLAAI